MTSAGKEKKGRKGDSRVIASGGFAELKKEKRKEKKAQRVKG